MSIKKAIFSLVGSLMTGYAAAVLAPVFSSARHAQSRTVIDDKKMREKRERRKSIALDDDSTLAQSSANGDAKGAVDTNSTSSSHIEETIPVTTAQGVRQGREMRRSIVQDVTPATPVFYRPRSYSPSRSTRSHGSHRSHSSHRSHRSGR